MRGIERLADRANAPIHHVGRCDDVAAGFGLNNGLLDQYGDSFVVEDDAVAQQPVVAMTGKGVKRHITEDADLRHFPLDCADGPADEIVRVKRFASRLIAQARIGVWEERDARNGQMGSTLGLTDRMVDRQPLNAGHGGNGMRVRFRHPSRTRARSDRRR